MYTQIFLVTSVRGMVFPPQISANAGLRVFGAKMPTPFFFIIIAFFLADALFAFLPAVIFFNVAFVTVVVLVVISIEERLNVHASLSL